MKPFSFAPIRTARLLIRPLEPGDYEAWRAAHLSMRPKRNRFERGPLPKSRLTRAIFRQHLAREKRLRRLDAQYNLELFDRRTGEHLGRIDFMIYARLIIQSANLGYAIHNRHWGKGLATEAVLAAIPHAFRRLKLHRIEASTYPSHQASIAVMKKSGLKAEGKRRSFLYEQGKWRDLVFYSAVAEEWGISSKPTVRLKPGDSL